jgi:pilus assembly protein Flp/PilA
MLRVHIEILRAYSALRDRVEREEGQALVEYALILALIAVVSILILQALGLNVSRVFQSVNSQISTVVP